MGLSIYHTHTHSLGRMSEREKLLGSERETTIVGRSSLCFQVLIFGADSIFEEVARFSPLWFPQGKFFVSLVSCDVLMFYCYACYSLSEKDPKIIMLAYIMHMYYEMFLTMQLVYVTCRKGHVCLPTRKGG